MSTVVWFRSDLRADDNSALAEAARDGGRVTGLFLLTPAQWGCLVMLPLGLWFVFSRSGMKPLKGEPAPESSG